MAPIAATARRATTWWGEERTNERKVSSATARDLRAAVRASLSRKWAGAVEGDLPRPAGWGPSSSFFLCCAPEDREHAEGRRPVDLY